MRKNRTVRKPRESVDGERTESLKTRKSTFKEQ